MDNLSQEHWDIDYILDKYHEIPSWDSRFKSERHFFDLIGFKGMQVLDVGCAAGGLYHALKEHFGDLSYTGIDVSEKLLKRGRELAPHIDFVHADITASEHNIKQNSFDIAVATGVFQHDPRHQVLEQHMLSAVKDDGYVLFDVKLLHTHPTICDKSVAYGDHGDHRVYYIALHIQDFLKKYIDNTNITSLHIYGYYTGAHPTVHLPDSVNEEICSAHVLLQKGKRSKDTPLTVNISLPTEYLDRLVS